MYSSRNIEKERLLEVRNYFYAINVTASLAFSDVPDGVWVLEDHVAGVEGMRGHIVAWAKDFIAPLEHALAEVWLRVNFVLEGEAEGVCGVGVELFPVDEGAWGGGPPAIAAEPVLGNSLAAADFWNFVLGEEQAAEILRIGAGPSGNRDVCAEVQGLPCGHRECVEAQVSIIDSEVDLGVLVGKVVLLDHLFTIEQG